MQLGVKTTRQDGNKRHASYEMFLAYKTEMWKEIWRLDQKDVVEFMELKVSSKIENRRGIKDSAGKTNKRNVSVLCVVCRFNDVVSERTPPASL